MADEVQGVREFGSESSVQSVQTIVNERLGDMAAKHDLTLENLRLGAIKGRGHRLRWRQRSLTISSTPSTHGQQQRGF
jgi:surface antigen